MNFIGREKEMARLERLILERKGDLPPVVAEDGMRMTLESFVSG
jgi:hypothetical protein